MTGHSGTKEAGADALIGQLTEQRDFYAQLKALSEQQAGLIERGETERLLGVLSQRQGLVEALGRLSAQLTPLRERWPEVAAGLPEPKRQRVRDLLSEVESLLGSILAQDARDRDELAAGKQRAAAQLGQIARGGAALGAYGKRPPGPTDGAMSNAARFTDQRG